MVNAACVSTNYAPVLLLSILLVLPSYCTTHMRMHNDQVVYQR